MSLEPGSPEWRRTVTASKVAAIIGVSPWDSPLSMWHSMRGDVADEPRSSAALDRGNLLENAVINWWLTQHPEITGHVGQHKATVDVGFPALATLDALAVDADGTYCILEAKTAARMDEWGEPGTDALPAHYLTQVYFQLAMTPQAERAYVAVLGPFLEFSEYVVERDEQIQADLIERCRRFYESLSADVPPPLDDHPATLATVRRLHPEIDRGESAEIDRDTALEYLSAVDAAKAATARERQAKAAVYNAAGRAQYVTHAGLRIARRQPGRGEHVNLIKTATLEEIQ